MSLVSQLVLVNYAAEDSHRLTGLFVLNKRRKTSYMDPSRLTGIRDLDADRTLPMLAIPSQELQQARRMQYKFNRRARARIRGKKTIHCLASFYSRFTRPRSPELTGTNHIISQGHFILQRNRKYRHRTDNICGLQQNDNVTRRQRINVNPKKGSQ